MPRSGFALVALSVAAAFAAALAALFAFAPRKDGAIDWTGQLAAGGWRAWTLPVALFFLALAALLALMILLAVRYPETPRVGILRIETTRGDRLFITLLVSAFINLAWLFFFGAPLWGALIVCLVFAAAVFRWV